MGVKIPARAYLFDLDGTIYHGGKLIGDAKNTLKGLRAAGSKIIYLTNNSSCDKACYESKLRELGVWENDDEVYSSLDCAVEFFTKKRAGKKVYAVACEKVRAYLQAQGVPLVSEQNAREADILLLTFDKEITYEKMVVATELIVLGKEYIATHPDYVCPTDGISVPDAGSFIEMFKASSGRTPDIILGKPYGYMADFLVDGLGFPREQVIMVGDRLYTDIQFGVSAGLKTALVLSGETTPAQYERSELRADYLLRDVNELVER